MGAKIDLSESWTVAKLVKILSATCPVTTRYSSKTPFHWRITQELILKPKKLTCILALNKIF